MVDQPPDWLRGYCEAHPANNEKRYRLYRMFWSLLNKLGVWRDEEYLQLKERRTVRDDRREIMPICIKSVSVRNYIDTCVYTNVFFLGSSKAVPK